MSEKDLLQINEKQAAEESAKSERRGENKSETENSSLLSSSPANRANNLIAANAAIAVGSRLQGQKCEIYVNNMRIQLSPKYTTFPNVVIISGEPTFTDNGTTDTLVNPTVSLEIIAKSTTLHDKTEKLELYLAMDSIKEYLVVKEDEMRVEHYSKQNAKQWTFRIYDTREDIITLEGLNCKLTLAEVYAQIKLGQPTKAQGGK